MALIINPNVDLRTIFSFVRSNDYISSSLQVQKKKEFGGHLCLSYFLGRRTGFFISDINQLIFKKTSLSIEKNQITQM